MKTLEHSLAVVSGASSGIGAATAEFLQGKGAKVFALDLKPSLNQKLEWIKTDVSNNASVVAAFEQISREKLPLRVCINCAGIATAGKILDRQLNPLAADAFDSVIKINLLGSFYVMSQAAALMAKTEMLDEDGERGVIINTASIAAFEGQIGQAAYAASKSGITGLTLPAARELAQHHIRVMAIAPGLVDTPMLQGLPEKVRQSLSASIPYPKRLGKPAEFAELCWQIIQNPLLNGSVIRLDAALRMA